MHIMADSKDFVELAKKLNEALPEGIKSAGQDMRGIFVEILQNQFAKMDLVTREEFDAQTKVLQRSYEKL